MTEKNYNGWSDRSTWAVNLHITNEEWSDKLLTTLVTLKWHPLVGDGIRALAKQCGVLEDITEQQLREANVREIYDTQRNDRLPRCPGCGELGDPCENQSCVRTDD
jgi:hypothetical protein